MHYAGDLQSIAVSKRKPLCFIYQQNVTENHRNLEAVKESFIFKALSSLRKENAENIDWVENMERFLGGNNLSQIFQLLLVLLWSKFVRSDIYAKQEVVKVISENRLKASGHYW